MTTKKLLFVIMFFVTSLGDSVFSQTTSVVVSQRSNDFVFKFNNNSALNNYFLGLEVVDNSNYLVKGVELNQLGLKNNYVTMVNILNRSIVWEKIAFSAQNVSESFSGDVSVYKTSSETLFYATTRNNVEVYEVDGDLKQTLSFPGTKSKLVQKGSNDFLLITKIVDGSLYMYRMLNLQVIDSVQLLQGVQNIESRCYESISCNWFLTVRLSGINTAILKVNPDMGIEWQKTFSNSDRSWVYSDESRVYVVSSVFTPDFKYRTQVSVFNQVGEQMWQKIFIPSSSLDSSSVAKNITYYPGVNSGCTIVGKSNNNPYVATFDLNGELLWEYSFTESNRMPISVSWNNLNELIIGGSQGSDCYLSSYFIEGVTTSIDDPTSPVPENFILHQNYPNPFNPTTKISYSLPTSTQVQLVVYNQLGEVVSELVNGYEISGTHEVTFNGNGLSSGVYFARLMVGAQALTKKMILMK